MPHIIIADDNQNLLDILAEFGRRAGWTVETCTSGAGIKSHLGSGTDPVLLLIDIMMPEVDGIEAITELETTDRPLRIRFMSGGEIAPLLAARMIANARSLQVGRNILKPIDKSTFTALLDEEAELLANLNTD
ncbi:response regulator [Antarctobacter jejuensis]|uniref:response regulator n=1 Tax=Antarctobacter jejuensis TaxID=1439938 RepID=UPI003FD2168E